MCQQVQGCGGSPTEGADHHMPNSIGQKGRQPGPLKGLEVETPAVLRGNQCENMWD